jgi:hypothetical protein
MDEPRGFVVVGETDWFDLAGKSADMAVDSRLRQAVNPTGTYGCVGGALVLDPAELSSPVFLACRVIAGANARWQFGMVQSDVDISPSNTQGQALTTAFVVRGPTSGQADIYSAGSLAQGSLGSFTAGDLIGLRLRNDGGTFKAQFYKGAAALGTEFSPTAGKLWRFFVSGRDSTNAWQMICDGPDLPWIPPGAQPWGAAARVADRGGYSPAASLLNQAGSNTSIDTFGRTLTAVAGGGHGRAAAALRRSRLRYVEFVIELYPSAAQPRVGVSDADTGDVSLNMGQVGSNAWGWRGGAGRWQHEGTDSGAVVTYTTGDVLGIFYDPDNGLLWRSKNGVIVSGDPEAGTGAEFSGIPYAFPAITPELDGRIRICTHAREQQYRPAYAEASDGADLLPEQHYTNRLRSAPSVRRAVSYFPWANQRNRGAAIGSIDLNNADGLYDALSEYDLRDQPVIAYTTRADGSTAREFTGLVDGVTQPDARTCRIAVADVSAKLDVRVDAPVFAVGTVSSAPVLARNGTTLTSDVCQEPRSAFAVHDQGLAVTSFVREDSAAIAAFRRTVNPAGLQSVQDLRALRTVQTLSVPNQDLEDWIGSAPDAWDTSTGGTASVARDGSNNRLVVNAGNSIAVAGFEAGFSGGTPYTIQIAFTAYNDAGAVRLWISDSAADAYGGVGQDAALIVQPGGPTSGLVTLPIDVGTGRLYGCIRATGTASITVDYVRVWETADTSLPSDAFGYLINERGAGAISYEFSSAAGNYPRTNAIGDWAKENPTIRRMIERINDSLLLDYYTDAAGVLQFAALIPPEEVTLAADGYLGEIAEADLLGELAVADDYAPALTDQARYQANYIEHNDGDIAGAVTTEARQYLTGPGRVNKLDLGSSALSRAAKALHPFYGFAVDGPVWERVITEDVTDDPDPLAAVVRDQPLIVLHRCYAARRRFYSFRISRERYEALSLRPGGVVELTHRRYGLAAGKNLMVVSIEPRLGTPTVPVTLWG